MIVLSWHKLWKADLYLTEKKIEAHKIHARSESFLDHYSQAKLFYQSQSKYEKNHIKDAISFELSKVKTAEIQDRVIQMINNINMDLAKYVAEKLGKIKDSEGKEIDIKDTFFNTASVLFNAVYVASREDNYKALTEITNAIEFMDDAIKHCKAVGGDKGSEVFFNETKLFAKAGKDDKALTTDGNVKNFIQASKQHRNWDREVRVK